MKTIKSLWGTTVALTLMIVLILPEGTALGGEMHTPTSINSNAWNLIWSDEFDGSAVNTNDWNFNIGGEGWGNNELQYYTDGQNVTVANGELVITAQNENGGYTCWYGPCEYTSTRMTTKAKQEFKYGRVETRMKLSTGQGLWPAFWMLGSNFDQVGWPASGEIDIMEHINLEETVYGTIHWDAGGYASYGCPSTDVVPTVDVTQYHVYDIEWDAEKIAWHVDGILYCEANILDNINSTEEFHEPFYILLNLAVGGDWPGSPDAGTVFPASMVVDYVRVYSANADSIFTDVPSTYWAWSFIERLYNAGITGGCNTAPLMYCPEATVTRAQMAVFILRGMHGSTYAPPSATGTIFADVPVGAFAADWIEQFATEGVTAGCGGGNYCPDATITRAQMAIFLLRGEHGSTYIPPVATGVVFSDVPAGSFAANWIEQLAAEGITSGCGGGNYCPDNPVTRAEMAVFLVRAFSLP